MNIEEVKNRKLIGSILNAITENQAEAKRHLEFGKVVLKDHARYEVFEIRDVLRTGECKPETSSHRRRKSEKDGRGILEQLFRPCKTDERGRVRRIDEDGERQWRLRFAFTLFEWADALKEREFSKSERSFGSAFQAVEVMERELVKRRNGEEEKLLMKRRKNGLTRLKLTVALADFERAILQRASGEEPSRVSKAMKRAEMIAKDVHAMDEHARELFQFSSLRCASKIEEGDVAGKLKGANDWKRCEYHKKRMEAHLEETSFVERILVKAGLIEWRKKMMMKKKSKDDDISADDAKDIAVRALSETAKEWIPERQVIARAENFIGGNFTQEWVDERNRAGYER